MYKHIMFQFRGRRHEGPFEAQWDPDSEDCPRIDIGGGKGVVIPDDAPEHIGAEFQAQVYDMIGRPTRRVRCQVV